MNSQQLLDRFGTSWKDEIHSTIGNAIRSTVPKEAAQVPKLESTLKEVEVRLVRSDGGDSTKWGVLIDSIRRKTGSVTTEAKASLLDWIRNACLENEVRGLNALLAEDGYLRHMMENLKAMCQPVEGGSKPEFDVRKEQAAKDATFYEEQRDTLLKELSYALRSVGLTVLGAKNLTIEKLLERLRNAEEQLLFAKVELCLLDEAKKVAKAAVDLLREEKALMEPFQKAVPGWIAGFEATHDEFLNFGSNVLMIRLFDREKDWGAFYVLDVDEQGDSKPVSRKTEYHSFLEQKLNAKATLVDLIELFRKNSRDSHQRLSDFCDDRFWKDLDAHPRPINLLEHPQYIDRRAEVIDRLVRSARPMMRQAGKMAGANLATARVAYLGISDADSNQARAFAEDVGSLLKKAGYDELNVKPTGRTDEIYLYLVNYAFPLPALPIVTNECHGAYSDFYRALREGRVGSENANIELHLSKAWEGKLSDLLVYTDEEARKERDARFVLLFGTILKVLSVKDVKGQTQYGIKLGPPSFKVTPLGSRREASEILRSDFEQRQLLISVIAQRERDLKEQLPAYYWALQYLRFSSEFAPDSPEDTLLEMKVHDENVYGSLLRGGVSEQELDVPERSYQEMAEYCKQKAAANLEWFGTFPILKNLEGWTKPSTVASS